MFYNIFNITKPFKYILKKKVEKFQHYKVTLKVNFYVTFVLHQAAIHYNK